ncbi:MAG: CAP domain-containing protein [Microgenomates group bacterium]
MNAIKKFFSYLFLPAQHNNYRAKVIHHDVLTAYLVVGFLLVSLNKFVVLPFDNVLGLAKDITVTKLVEYTNEQRVNNGLKPLIYNQKLATAAANKAQNMFANNYWAHFGPNGETPWQFITASGYRYESAGENLAKNFLYSKNVVSAWMNSPTHRENMLRKDFTEVGFAVVDGGLVGEQTTLVVQMFGRPSEAIQVQNKTTTTKKITTKNSVLSEFTTAQMASAPKPMIQLPFTSTQLASGFLIYLLGIFALDFYMASKLKLVRMHGKSLAHFIFLFAIAIATIMLLVNGTIL